jgi:hypothetical protein
MLTHFELAAQVETKQVAKSAAPSLMGKNVRSPSLQRGKLYLMKEWTIKHHANYDNPFTVVRFIGCGTEDSNGQRVLVEHNYKLNEMQDGQYYYFEAVDSREQKLYTYGAYMFENCLCICSGAVRVTCYQINGCEYDEKAPAKGPSSPASSVVKRSKRSDAAFAEEPEERSVFKDDDCADDESVLKYSIECHPLSLMPLDRKQRNTFCRA